MNGKWPLNDERRRERGTLVSEFEAPLLSVKSLLGPVLTSNPAFGKLSTFKSLQESRALRDILNGPCFERLAQERYYDLTSTRTLSVSTQSGDYEWTLKYSLISTVLSFLIAKNTSRDQGAIAGEFLVNVTSDRSHRLLDFELNLDSKWLPSGKGGKVEVQEGKQRTLPNLVYVPIGLSFETSAGARGTGHAMALFIDHVHRTVEVYEPNGVAPWVPAVERAASLALLSPLSSSSNESSGRNLGALGYRMLTRDESVVGWIASNWDDGRLYRVLAGPQSISHLPMCAYFSGMYAYLRLTHSDLEPNDLNRVLAALGETNLRALVQRFHCYVVNLALDLKIFSQSKDVSDLLSSAFSKFRRLSNKRNLADKARVLNKIQMAFVSIQSIAVQNIITGSKYLLKLDRYMEMKLSE